MGSSKNLYSVCSVQNVSLTHPGWNGANGETCPKNMPSAPFTKCFSTHPGWNGAYGDSSHKAMLRTLCKECFSTSKLKWWLQGTPPTTHTQYTLYGMFLLHIMGWNGVYKELLPQTHAQYALVWMFHLHMHVKMVPRETPPTNPYPVCSL